MDQEFSYNNIVQGALTFVEEDLELPPPRKSSNEPPEWPGNVADLDDGAIGEHMAYWVAMRSYAAWHLALADTNRSVIEEQLRMLEAKLLLLVVDEPVDGDNASDRARKSTAGVMKARVLQDPDIQAANEQYQSANARYKLLQALHQGYEQRYQAISREISRRQSERRGTGP